DDRELARLLLNRARDAKDVLCTLGAAQLRPVLVVRVARGADGVVDVARVSLGDLGELLFGARAERREVFAGARLLPLAADPQVVTALEGDVVGRLGRRRVLPHAAEIEGVRDIARGRGGPRSHDPTVVGPRSSGRGRDWRGA